MHDHEEQRRPPLRIVVPFEDSPAGWGGLRHAAELARTWGPGRVIARRAAELQAGMLVLGVQRRGTLDRLLFGSVAESIMLNAAGPVLMVPVASDG